MVMGMECWWEWILHVDLQPSFLNLRSSYLLTSEVLTMLRSVSRKAAVGRSPFGSPLSGVCANCLGVLNLRRHITSSSSIPNNPDSNSNSEEVHDFSRGGEQEDSDGGGLHPYKRLFPWKSRPEFAEYLAKQVVHNDDGLIAINKPFGVGVIHAPAKQKGNRPSPTHLRRTGMTDYSLEMALPYLRKIWEKPNLVLAKSTERMTSGIAVFTEDMEHAEKFQRKLRISKQLSNMKANTPLYKYLTVTTGFPFNNQSFIEEKVGIILKTNPLSEIPQPVIERKYAKKAVQKGGVKTAHVTTNVLSQGVFNTCLLKIETSSVKWNFLRVYCADLMIPILGDHLFSCRVHRIMGVPTKLDIGHAPPGSADQKLFAPVLSSLHVDESIEVPPHIHLSSYSLHNYRGKGNHLELKAPIPEYFQWTLGQLHLSCSDS